MNLKELTKRVIWLQPTLIETTSLETSTLKFKDSSPETKPGLVLLCMELPSSRIGYFATYFQALHNVSALHHLVSTKIAVKGRFLLVSAGAGLVTSFFASWILTSSFGSSRQSLLRNEVFPAWLQRDRVVNPDRVFFELDDNHHNEPTIWHSSM